MAKRENVETVEDANAADCPLTKIWTWLTLFALLVVSVLAFEKSISIINDLLWSYVIGGSYLLTFLILAVCAAVLGATRLFSGMTKKNNFRLLSSSVLISLGVGAVFSMLFGSTLIEEFFSRISIITH
ncbi:MAG: hypothetical protein ACR2LT_00325 [Pyrinomonadaceae bacterium]